MREIRKIIIAIFIIAIFNTMPVYASTAYLPQSFDISNNYYTVFGEPNLTATLIGSNEFEQGESVVLSMNVLNSGKILGLELKENLIQVTLTIQIEKSLLKKKKIMNFKK